MREQHGFQRSICDCPLCAAPCKHIPGSLDVADLERLCPEPHRLFDWAEQHLRAVIDKPFPTLVPARNLEGHCHWFAAGRCLVHENAPYSCAFFDAHMTEEEIARRSSATIEARKRDAAEHGLYFRLWSYLKERGLVARSGDRAALLDEVRRLSY